MAERQTVETNSAKQSVTISAQTTGNALTQVFAVPVAEEQVVMVWMNVVGNQTTGGARAGYQRTSLFYRNSGGNVTLQGAYSFNSDTVESDSDWNCTLSADTSNQTIDCNVQGDTGQTVNWLCTIEWMTLQQ